MSATSAKAAPSLRTVKGLVHSKTLCENCWIISYTENGVPDVEFHKPCEIAGCECSCMALEAQPAAEKTAIVELKNTVKAKRDFLLKNKNDEIDSRWVHYIYQLNWVLSEINAQERAEKR